MTEGNPSEMKEKKDSEWVIELKEQTYLIFLVVGVFPLTELVQKK